MLESMERLIRDQHMISPGTTVLCALSGGADSVCLLHALYRLRPRLGVTLLAAHYNHNLRGEESLRDEAFVRQFVTLCCGPQRMPDGTILPAVPLFIGSGDVKAEAERRKSGLEETARDMRYAFLRQTAAEQGAQYIATAHTADDNAETILLHLARGSGLRGLTGIPPVRDNVIRPLLTTPRKDVEAYLYQNVLPHMEDSSNRDMTFSRNRIRHQVVPVLESLYPGFAGRMADCAALLRADEELLSAQAGELTRSVRPHGAGIAIPAAELTRAPTPISSRAVRQLLGTLSDDQNLGGAHLESVLSLCRGDDPSARLSLPHGITARREYELLVLEPTESPEGPPDDTPLPLPGRANFGPWQVTCTAEIYKGQPQGPWDFWLDRDTLPDITLRARRTGDRITLPGRPRKTVKKWWVEEKLPAHLRPSLPLLVRKDQIAAAAGLGPEASLCPAPGAPAWRIRVEINKAHEKTM